ncbi:hypothetical protein ABIC01_008513 [Bradyrhizobium sp. RT4b]
MKRERITEDSPCTGGLSWSSTRRGSFSSNRRQRTDTTSIAYQTAFSANVLLRPAALVWFIAPWLKELNWNSQIALRRKSTDQSRSVQVAIPSAEMVILGADEDVEW